MQCRGALMGESPERLASVWVFASTGTVSYKLLLGKSGLLVQAAREGRGGEGQGGFRPAARRAHQDGGGKKKARSP